MHAGLWPRRHLSEVFKSLILNDFYTVTYLIIHYTAGLDESLINHHPAGCDKLFFSHVVVLKVHWPKLSFQLCIQSIK